MDQSLPTTSKSERRSKSKSSQTSIPSLVLAFFSCLAWLYVAGRYAIGFISRFHLSFFFCVCVCVFYVMFFNSGLK